jgi:hypothetical protein
MTAGVAVRISASHSPLHSLSSAKQSDIRRLFALFHML